MKDQKGHGSDADADAQEHHGRSNMEAGKERSSSEWTTEMSKLRDIKPVPINRMWNDLASAPPDRVAAHKDKIRGWESKYRSASKSQKEALERDNAAFYAKNK